MKLKLQERFAVLGVLFCLIFVVWNTDASADTEGLGTFSFGLKPGIFIMPNMDQFEVTYTKGSTTTHYSISGNAMVGLYPYLRLGITNKFGLEAQYGYEAGADNLSLKTASGLLIYMFREKGFRPYIKGGVIWGEFTWDGLPGSFDSGIGGGLGGGFEVGGERIAFTMDILYRHLTNKYNYDKTYPSSVTKDQIDLSGVGVLAGLVIRF